MDVCLDGLSNVAANPRLAPLRNHCVKVALQPPDLGRRFVLITDASIPRPEAVFRERIRDVGVAYTLAQEKKTMIR